MRQAMFPGPAAPTARTHARGRTPAPAHRTAPARCDASGGVAPPPAVARPAARLPATLRPTHRAHRGAVVGPLAAPPWEPGLRTDHDAVVSELPPERRYALRPEPRRSPGGGNLAPVGIAEDRTVCLLFFRASDVTFSCV